MVNRYTVASNVNSFNGVLKEKKGWHEIPFQRPYNERLYSDLKKKIPNFIAIISKRVGVRVHEIDAASIFVHDKKGGCKHSSVNQYLNVRVHFKKH